MYSPEVNHKLKSLSIDDMLSLPINADSILNYSPNNTQHLVYRKVRPEPINEKSIVGSVVDFMYDVVGAGVDSKHNLTSAKRQQHNTIQSGSSSLLSNVSASSTPLEEIKEQAVWLHFEPICLLDASKNIKANNTPLLTANLVLMIGYKTGFSIWTIDVIKFNYNLGVKGLN